MFIFVFIGFLVIYLIVMCSSKKEYIEDLEDDKFREVSPKENEIMIQEELVDMYYKIWLRENEKLIEIPSYKKQTDTYYKQWKKATEAKAKYLKADARLNKLKSENDDISFTIQY